MQYIEYRDFKYLIKSILSYLSVLNNKKANQILLNDAAINHIINALSFKFNFYENNKFKINNINKKYDNYELNPNYGFADKDFSITSPIIVNNNDSYILHSLKDEKLLKEKGIILNHNLKKRGNYKFYEFSFGNTSKNYSPNDNFVKICKFVAEFYAILLKRNFSLPENIYFQIATLDILFDILFENYKKVIDFEYSLSIIVDCIHNSARPQYNKDDEIDKIIIIDAFLDTCKNIRANKKTLDKYINDASKKFESDLLDNL